MNKQELDGLDVGMRLSGAFSLCNGLRVLEQAFTPFHLDHLEYRVGLPPNWIHKTAHNDVEPAEKEVQKIAFELFGREHEFERICYDTRILELYLRSVWANDEKVSIIIRRVLVCKTSVIRILSGIQADFETDFAKGLVRYTSERVFWTDLDLTRQQSAQ